MQHFEKYFKDLQGHKLSDITEHSHRKSLQNLIEDIAAKQKGKFKILHEPKREGKFGSPDFKITSTESILGYIENKKVDENLDKTLKSDQIKKYKELSKNIILTNYIDWIWLKDGEEIDRQSLCSKSDIENKKAKLNSEKAEKVEALITKFFSQAPEQIANAKILAEELAIRAKRLKEFLFEELTRQKDEDNKGRLYQLFETFRQFIFQELTIEEFADAFAQNLVYGLFLAKLNADNKTVDIYNAKKFIPNSFDLIRELVNFLDELDNEEYRETKWIVEEVLTILNNLNLKEINRTLHYSKTQTTNLFGENEYFYKDPFVYFYEHFLSVYDKKLREAKGVYYTPPPVVNFIVRGVNDILKNTFKIKEGLASKEKVTVLDFATGTGTFLLEVFQQIFDSLPKDSAKKDALIREHILKNIYGFEYLIAPYTIAHLKLSQFLKDQGYSLQNKERLQIFLTNTLEPIDKQIKIPLLPALTEESKEAQKVKDKPILVITGNPPYSISSSNTHNEIINLIEDYKSGLNEKKLNLDDDYIKFIRFAHHKMENVERGVIAIITNNSFYDGVNHRKMRESLFETFDNIYILNLHGNNRLKEKSPDGSADENVFDILVGTGITILVKDKNIKKKEVFYDELYGKRAYKYKELFSSDLNRSWKVINPKAPYFVFKPFETKENVLNNQTFSLNEIFNLKGSAVKTDRDELFYDFNSKKLSQRIKTLLSGSFDDEFIEKYNVKNSGSYKLLEKLPKNKFEETAITPCFYRPFDSRFLYYKQGLTSRPNYELNKNLLQENLCLVIGRSGNAVSQVQSWNLAFITNKIVDTNIFYRGGGFLFPLYIMVGKEKKVNFSAKFDEYIKKSALPHTAEIIFSYLYACLHSPTYREKYADELNIDFPNVSFTNDKKIFIKVAELGQKLINAHLLKDISDFDDDLGNYMGGKNHEVEKLRFVIEKGIGKLYINSTNYFNNVPESVNSFHIGGYQVLEKYLKDRKGLTLDSGEMDQIESIVRAIAFTIETMKQIDKLTKDWI